jgi:hypothetical protein
VQANDVRRSHTLRRHHRAGAISAFTRVFDALWRRDPVIHVFLCRKQDVDGRVKPGHDVDSEMPPSPTLS